MFGLKGEPPLGVGGGALRCAFHAEGHTGQGFAFGVHYRARHLLTRLGFLRALCGGIVFMGSRGGLSRGGKKETQREG